MTAAAPDDPGTPWVLLLWATALVASLILLGGPGTLAALLVGLQALYLAYFVRHFAFALSAGRSAATDARTRPVDTGYRPTVSVLVACKDEELVIPGLVASLSALDYPADRLEFVLVDDGSSDDTPDLLDAHCASDARMRVLHRPPDAGGGKSGALNEALFEASGEIIVVFDADHQPRPAVLARLVRHFQDPTVSAAQGRCEIANAHESLIARIVALDYLAGYHVNEYGRQSLFALPAYGGANCAVRATALRAVGGWNPHTVTEDTDLTLRLLLMGHRVRYDVSAVDEEQGVVTLRRFWRQRYRWARGHQQAWRDYAAAVWRSPHLGRAEKVETTMFLFAFHLPVMSAVGLLGLLAWYGGVALPFDITGVFVLWTLLFLGPLLEVGTGLLVAGESRREAPITIFFLVLFGVSMAVCTKAWIDSVVGRSYRWAKTQRTKPVPVTT